MVLSPRITILLCTSLAKMWSAPVQPSTISSIRTPSCRACIKKNELNHNLNSMFKNSFHKKSPFNSRHSPKYSPQTVAVCLPWMCVSGCPGVPSRAAGLIGVWHPAHAAGRDWLDIAPGYGSDQLWPGRGSKTE